ncbi:hypothetical protein [Rubellicoccus peritrichatus]|uniref:Glycosyltransferase RgtA/B/C/D-like domain-containing protein n=1 Tax=Rubellicoccus peritrichatus TaxID=3080537 RepID=A0AAQ3L6G3_9BACT|nr:hypothetical protein [Puniceicoccus sp. CR14]WOO40190.1 hypothetical protein RZN69_16335 [Puniceicoccus sp. CR14]
MSAFLKSAVFGRFAFCLGVILILGTAGFLYLDDLGERPVHFDEATGARILADRIESGSYHFDPNHFHGPLLSMVSAPVVSLLQDETTWETLSITSLRISVALLALLTVSGAFYLERFGKRGDGLAAAAFVATSPLLAYYGTMYIHEPVFTACGLLSVISLWLFLRGPSVINAILVGIGFGLMAVTRETFVIAIFSWLIASIIWLFSKRGDLGLTEWLKGNISLYVKPLILAAVVSLVILVLGYSDFGKNSRGVFDFIQTYFAYKLVSGHEKPFYYYFQLLLWPQQLGWLWWTQIGVLLFALIGYIRYPVGAGRDACRFFFHGGLVYLLVFSFISYKTPWLASLGWLQICLAAGMGAAAIVRSFQGFWRVPVVTVVALVLSWQYLQSYYAIHRFSSDARNPYAYVPTSKDLERLPAWLEELQQLSGGTAEVSLAVIGREYWPLPWYLRKMDSVGYWPELPSHGGEFPIILVLPSAAEESAAALEESHTLIPRGLREEVLVMVAVRNDVWNKYMKNTDGE